MIHEQLSMQISTPDDRFIIRSWSHISLKYQDHFHDPVEVIEEVERIHSTASPIVDVFNIGQSYMGRNITCLRITNEEMTYQKPRTLVVAHHHAREQITVEMALRFILMLVNGYGSNPDITDYVDTTEIFVIPTLNPDGLDRVINDKDYWLRKNLHPFDNDNDGELDEDPIEDVDGDGWVSRYEVYRKEDGVPFYTYSYYEGIDNDDDGSVNEDEIGYVDLNRNYNGSWGGSGSSGWPTEQTYRGRRPFSEPETQAIRDFIEQHRYAIAYSLHSGINATYLPTNHHGYVEPDLYELVVSDYQEILPSDFLRGGYGSQYSEDDDRFIDSSLNGKWMDWMYLKRATPIPMCFEVFHDGWVDQQDAYTIYEDNSTHLIKEWHHIYGYFNPPAHKIDQLWSTIRPAFTYLLDMVPKLSVEVTPLPNANPASNYVRVQVDASVTGIYLGSIDPLYIETVDGTLLYSLPAIDVDESLTERLTLALPFNASTAPFTLRIGNNYTGYRHIEVTRSTETTTTSSPATTPTIITTTTGTGAISRPLDFTLILSITSIGVVVAIVLVVYLRKRSGA